MNKKELPKWKEQTNFEKILSVIVGVLAVLILILAILDAFDKIEALIYYEPLFVLLMFVTSILYFKYDKKKAILFIICGILVLLSYIMILVL